MEITEQLDCLPVENKSIKVKIELKYHLMLQVTTNTN